MGIESVSLMSMATQSAYENALKLSEAHEGATQGSGTQVSYVSVQMSNSTNSEYNQEVNSELVNKATKIDENAVSQLEKSRYEAGLLKA